MNDADYVEETAVLLEGLGVSETRIQRLKGIAAKIQNDYSSRASMEQEKMLRAEINRWHNVAIKALERNQTLLEEASSMVESLRSELGQ